MRVLIIGSGGREHALVWKISQSPLVSGIFCAPGNAGTEFIGENVSIRPDEIEKLVRFAREKRIDLTVVGPEQPLVLGIVDRFEEEELKIFGPSQKAAELEGSKAFAKELMQRYAIPSASFRVFTDVDRAKDSLENHPYPLVIKADGLAAGKGVLICASKQEAQDALCRIMRDRIFGAAGQKVVIENFLAGEEVSYLAFVDGETVLPMASSQDHKAIFDDDRGPNTGGMGAYSPAPALDAAMMERVTREIALPLVRGMKDMGRPYKGVLYVGLMLTADGPKVLEFNCRFGDPETQPILFRMKSDVIPLMQASIDGGLEKCSLEWTGAPAVCVVMASEGYPGPYKKGRLITGLNEKGGLERGMVFHAGVDRQEGRLLTNGGRVLGVTATGPDIQSARDNAYRAVAGIHWEGAYYRRDIARKALTRS